MATHSWAARVVVCGFVAVGAFSGPVQPPGEAAVHRVVNGRIFYDQETPNLVLGNPDYDVWSIDPDGTGAVDLTPDPNTWAVLPRVSPDGSTVAYAYFDIASGEEGRTSIYLTNADGSGLATEVPNTEDGFDHEWSPDGKRLLVVKDEQSNGAMTQQLIIVNADGTGGITRLTDPGPPGSCLCVSNWWPAFSPDGKFIAFTSDRGGTQCGNRPCYAIFVMRSDGSKVRRLTDDRLRAGSPSWSPDGTKILFTSAANYPAASMDVYVVRADGGRPSPVLTSARQEFDADWSPDGRQIVLLADDGDLSFDIYTASARGGPLTQVTDVGGVASPDWATKKD